MNDLLKSATNQELILLIEQLYHARHEVAHVYDNPGEYLPDEAAEKLLPLVKNYFVRKVDNNCFSIRRELRQLLDLPLGRVKIASFDTNLLRYVQNIELNIGDIQEATDQGHLDDKARLVDDIVENISDIRDALENAVDRLYTKTENSFGLLSMSASKLAENKLYMASIEELIDSYNQVLKHLNHDSFHDDLEVSEVVSNLRYACMEYIDKLSVINDSFKKFMFRQRQIERQAAKIKALITHIGNYPGFMPSNALEHAEELEQTLKIKPYSVQPWTNIHDSVADEKFGPLIEDIFNRLNIDQPIKFERPPSELSGGKQREIKLIPSATEKNLLQMLKTVVGQNQAISVNDYFADVVVNTKNNITQESFLYDAVRMFEQPPIIKGKPINAYIKRHLILEDIVGFSGNKHLLDAYIYPAKMNQAQLEARLPYD